MEGGDESALDCSISEFFKFDLIFKYPDLGHLTYFDGRLNLESDIFPYLYKKI